MAAMDKRLPLSVLLSHALVAYTIEFDNEAERRLPHSTTYGTDKAMRGPWLVSMVMWWNCMRFVSDEGVTVRELERLARTATNFDGMRRWGYIRIHPDTAGARSKKPRPDAVLQPTAAGRMAQEAWRPLFDVIETRWEERFGKAEVGRLRDALRGLVVQFDEALPDCMPILHYGLATKVFHSKLRGAMDKDGVIDDDMALAALLAKALIAFALKFESQSEISLAVCANVVRVLGDGGVRVRDLPRLSGVSKEAIAMALGFLEKGGYVELRPESAGSKVKAAVLTAKGRIVREMYDELLTTIEGRWGSLYGEDVVRALREALQPFNESRLLEGMTPSAGNWRAKMKAPEVLPHFPMVLHRGGYPDGS
jgi:DNA-binding MarR family transcriptional regulator